VIGYTSSGDLTASVADLTRAMRAANREVGRQLGTVARKAQTAGVKAVRGSATLSGMRVTLGARAKVFAGADRVTVDVTANPPGPWSIVETGRGAVKAHGRALAIPGYPRASARAAKGRRGTWDRATDHAAEPVGKAIEAVFDEAWSDAG
jgi:hypothetical protein